MVKLPKWPGFVGAKDIDLKLDRVTKILAILDNPQKKLTNIIHIAGTNGKGSTAAFLRASSILIAVAFEGCFKFNFVTNS